MDRNEAVKEFLKSDDTHLVFTDENDMVPWTQEDELLKYKLQTLLKDNIVEVTFTKVDGEQRVMKCTLKNTLLPDSAYLTEDGRERSRAVPKHVLPVWDVEKKAWRSFRIESVHNYIVVRE